MPSQKKKESKTRGDKFPMKSLLALQRSRQQAPSHYSRNPRYLNRELSWLAFNDRVLQESRNRNNPLLEQLSFLAITASNLDEFFMVRVASLKDQVQAAYRRADLAGLEPQEQLEAIAQETHAMSARMYQNWGRLRQSLADQGQHFLSKEQIDSRHKELLRPYFDEYVYPILTPMAVDSGRPFPLISNRSLNLSVLLQAREDEDQHKFVTIQVPQVLARICPLPETEEGGRSYILLEDLIRLFLPEIFPQRRILASAVYRIMRNADLDFDEEEAHDLLHEIEKQLRLRLWGEVIRLEAEADIDRRLLQELLPRLKVAEQDIFLIDGPLDLRFLSKLAGRPEFSRREDLRYPPYQPQEAWILRRRREELAQEGHEEADIFDLIKRGPILLHHPYESFDPVLNFIRQAARDPEVLAIKQTLYRISGDSPIIGYLEEAARNGKQVLVLVELKARFDEENNIHWARRLEQAGCHVIYGLVGLKTHSKITLVVRREESGIRRYLHLGTGNYNDITARLYTDLGYFVSTEDLADDAVEFFNMLTGFAEPQEWKSLYVAPLWLRRGFETLIRREIQAARAGRRARIQAKMNSLVDQEMIDLLYEASAAGVEIDLIVRGICCLRPGIPGLSENIRVRSIVGRFLEHARIYMFHADGAEEVYLSSADWMSRNLTRRVELLFPVEDSLCRAAVKEIMQIQFNDRERAQAMQADGTYKRLPSAGQRRLDAQEELCRLALLRAPKEKDVFESRHFVPRGKDYLPMEEGREEST